jgi:hypothetical protein
MLNGRAYWNQKNLLRLLHRIHINYILSYQHMEKRSVFIMAVMMGCAILVMPTVTTVRGQNVTTPSGAVLVPCTESKPCPVPGCKVGYYMPYLNGRWTGQCTKMT